MNCRKKSDSKTPAPIFKSVRMAYALTAVLLIAVEVLIALFVNDSFIRPFVGDMLVVVVIWALLRIVVPDRLPWLSLYVFIFAASVEFMQYIDIVSLLGIEKNSFLGILIGSTFDIKDIACYAVGCIAAAVIDVVVFESRKNRAAQQ